MADILNIYQKCPQCKGAKEISEGEIVGEDEEVVYTIVTCPMCNGEGELNWGQMREEEL